MGWKTEINKELVWDNDKNKMVAKTSVNVLIVTNKGTIIAESGKVYCENANEVFEAQQALKTAMEKKLVLSTAPLLKRAGFPSHKIL